MNGGHTDGRKHFVRKVIRAGGQLVRRVEHLELGDLHVGAPALGAPKRVSHIMSRPSRKSAQLLLTDPGTAAA